MSQNNKNQPQQNPPQKLDLDPEIIKALVHQQALKLQIEQDRLRIEEKGMEQDARLAEKSMELNAELLKAEPQETRKSITRIFWIAFGLLLIFFGVLTLWIYIGQVDFAYKFLQGCSYLATTALGYFVGKKEKGKKKKDKEDTISDAEVVD